MKRLKRLVLALMCLSILAPSAASADDGGWLDWLYGLDTKLVGVGTDIHLRCLDRMGHRVTCEEWFGLRPGVVSFAEIKHEINFRVAYYHSYGDRFSDDPSDKGSLNTFKLMVLYDYRPDKYLAVGIGAGFMPFYGKMADGVTSFESFWRGIVTPISVTYSPAHGGPDWVRALYIRGESSYITKGFSGAILGNSTTAYDTHGGEWNASAAIGFDFRRRASTMGP